MSFPACKAQVADPQEPRGMQVGSEGEEEGDLPGLIDGFIPFA